MNDVIKKIRDELGKNADEKIREGNRRFFKEDICCYGMKTVTVGAIAKKYFKLVKDSPKKEILRLCDELWQRREMEERFIACNWSYAVHADFTPGDFKIFRRWVDARVSNWAECDTLCNHTIGEFLEMYPQYVAELKKWAVSKNRWMRRAAAVSLIVPARRGKFLDDVFAIADILLEDEDDMVQKGYGWMLKVAASPHLSKVFRYVMAHKAAMPRTALRYAIEKMPADLKAKAMAK